MNLGMKEPCEEGLTNRLAPVLRSGGDIADLAQLPQLIA
jgi:hypothetical protein